MGTRITSRGLAQAVLVAKEANPAVVIALAITATLAGGTGLKFTGTVTVGGTAYDLASTNGKLRLFNDADDFVKFVSVAVPSSTGAYNVEINTGTILSGSIPSDLVKAAAAKVVKLQAAKTSQQAEITAIDAQLALMVGWESGSPLQAAKKAETQVQRAAVVADIAAIDAEIVRLTP